MWSRFIYLLCLVLTLGDLFPEDFAWGTSTSAFQIEGSLCVSGRGPSIWDYYQTFPSQIFSNATADIAVDFYRRYPSDIKIQQDLGLKNFRLSISWTRVLPTGDPSAPNALGVKFYNDLLDSLLAAGIEPFVTLYHWDLPQSFNDFSNQSTWLDPGIVHKFNAYADFCFKQFGGKVKHWITLNEVFLFAWMGYGKGVHAPGRCSPEVSPWCEQIGGGGDSGTEPYTVAHHALLAHALAVQTYRHKYQGTQQGKIGMAIVGNYALPWNSSNAQDIEAVNIAVAFQFGWLADPQVFGSYPQEMTRLVTGGRLPEFNESMSALVRGSYDFLGLNHYFSNYVRWTGRTGDCYLNDGRYEFSDYNASGHLIGPYAESHWIKVYPKGMGEALRWIKKRYNDPEIYIFENGVSVLDESEMTEREALNDTFRMDYIYDHIMEMVRAVKEDGVRVKGYFLWSLLDNFEWNEGYYHRFGIVYVNYEKNLTRSIKNSGYMYSDLIKCLDSGREFSKDEVFSKYIEPKLSIDEKHSEDL